MYQIHLRVQASKLAALASDRQAGRIELPAGAARQSALGLRGALAGLARLATLRVMSSASVDIMERHDPRDPRNW